MAGLWKSGKAAGRTCRGRYGSPRHFETRAPVWFRIWMARRTVLTDTLYFLDIFSYEGKIFHVTVFPQVYAVEDRMVSP